MLLACSHHVASPVTFGTGDPEEDQKTVVDPAIAGELFTAALVVYVCIALMSVSRYQESTLSLIN